MKVAYINPEKCDRSPACPARRICPVSAISQKGKGLIGLLGGGTAVVNKDMCTGCGKCLNYCPTKAIKMVTKK